MKLVDFELDGQKFHLLLNAAALFDCYDRFGDTGDLTDHITGTSRESLDNTVWMLVKLAQQGEAYRRYLGFEKEKMLTVERAQQTMAPADVSRARAAIWETVHLGFSRQHRSEAEDIDLGLAELQKKTALASRLRNIWNGQRSCSN